MTDQKKVTPEMIRDLPQVETALLDHSGLAHIPLATALEAVRVALASIANDPIVPTDEDIDELLRDCPSTSLCSRAMFVALNWQVRMFIKTYPEKLKEYLVDENISANLNIGRARYNADILSAYALGLKEGKVQG